MTIMQLAGFPAEVVDSVVSVLCRMAFDFGLWSDGASPLLFVCEEAHSYASADRNVGFGPTRKAVSRIAKEGRKYGVHLALITQRPAELDATIISQCNTLFAMRLANDRDQALLRSAVSDAAANLLSFVPSLGTREVLGISAKASPCRPGCVSRKFLRTSCHAARPPSPPRPRPSTVTTSISSAPCWSAGAVQHRIAKRRTIRRSTAGAIDRLRTTGFGSTDAAAFARSRSRPILAVKEAIALIVQLSRKTALHRPMLCAGAILDYGPCRHSAA
jgi:hypothetical protein